MDSPNSWQDEGIAEALKENKVAVMPTDTLYGIVARAESEEAVERIYKLRHRTPEKPCIILIGGEGELAKFKIKLNEAQENKVKEYWPGPVSIILDCPQKNFTYLHRGTDTLAFRLPKNENLRALLLQTGPLIAPSANIEGLPPAEDVQEAKEYFHDSVDFYVDGGLLAGKPSKVVRLHKDGTVNIIRQ